MNTNHKIINITNITFSYNQKEDRLIFTINHNNIDQRIDFFVTRRMLIQLLEAFDHILINYCNNGKLFKELYNNQEILEENTDNKIDTNNINKEDNLKWEKSIPTKDLNFTKIKEAILLDSLSYNIKNNQITLKFISNNKILAISKLDFNMFEKTLSSMMRVIPFVSWGISPNILD
jgi:hypothetical protein